MFMVQCFMKNHNERRWFEYEYIVLYQLTEDLEGIEVGNIYFYKHVLIP